MTTQGEGVVTQKKGYWNRPCVGFYKENLVNAEQKSNYLRYALIFFGILMLLIYPLMLIWPSGWVWDPSQHEYEQMIIGIYATLGVFLILASKNPLAHASLIWFTVWSSVVHATIMLLQALYDSGEHDHLYGDIPALYIIAIVLAYLMPRTSKDKKGELHPK